MLLLETVGARSGEPRETPLLYVPDGDRVMLIASNGGNPRHPGWYHNLRARPEVTALIGGRRVRYAVREAEGDGREALWKQAAAVYTGYEVYRERVGERQIPVVLLTPVDEAEPRGESRV
jgi:deazaflavin-dependent oxidoreductase (nitroreductase family)